MGQYVELIGAESVASAGRQMSGAASDMRTAAGTMDEAARQMRVATDAFASQLELVLSEHRDRLAELLAEDRKAREPRPTFWSRCKAKLRTLNDTAVGHL